MSAKSNNVRDSLAEQLSSLDNRLKAKADDVHMLAEIQDGIGRLLATETHSEADIRAVLQDRYESGNLRKETFQLVKSMLDAFVTEHDANTEPLAARAAPDDTHHTITDVLEEAIEAPVDDKFSSTTIIDDVQEPAASADDRVQVGSLLRDRFLLQEKVAGGSMGVVYKALDRRLAESGSDDQYVAIKVLSPKLAKNGNALRALQQEAAKGRCLAHQNIVRFVDLDRDDDLYFIVMEWLEGKNLAKVLDDPKTKTMKLPQALKIIKQIGEALAYAHRCGIVHADVKPGNIILTPYGEAKLFDFGVARVKQVQNKDKQEFDPGTLGGVTPAYSSMQVLTGEEPAPSDDVFSLACLFYRMLAGYRVFGPRNAAEAAEEGMKPQRIEILDDAQWNALKKALSYARVTRFDSIDEFLKALDPSTDVPADLHVERNFDVVEPSGGIAKWLIAAVMILGGFGVVANQLGYLDEFKQRLQGIDVFKSDESPAVADAPVAEEPAIEDLEPQQDLEIQTIEPELLAEPQPEPEIVPEAPPLVDYTTFPPPALEVPLSVSGSPAETYTISLDEDGEAAEIEFVRADATEALAVRLEEVGHSGNRSPWASGQYGFSDGGIVEFPVGQDRGRISLTMSPDPLREADQQSTLRVRDVDIPTSELATITVFLRDDDQRAFEKTLPTNTVAFAMGQASVSEADPAAQLDILRFNPDSSEIVVSYRIESVTATENKDYFPPAWQEVSFGPGQRSARLLIPLVQDSNIEGDEAFVVELQTESAVTATDIYQRIVVMIRDDE
ncbi:MAG: protein kinase [Woeseiaceae bacterium]|nr:protein kinase [Woeseiaceae bacterium]